MATCLCMGGKQFDIMHCIAALPSLTCAARHRSSACSAFHRFCDRARTRTHAIRVNPIRICHNAAFRRKKGGRGGGLPVSIATIAASVLLLTTLWFAWGRTSYKSRWNKAERELSISTAEVYRMRADMMRHQV